MWNAQLWARHRHCYYEYIAAVVAYLNGSQNQTKRLDHEKGTYQAEQVDLCKVRGHNPDWG